MKFDNLFHPRFAAITAAALTAGAAVYSANKGASSAKKAAKVQEDSIRSPQQSLQEVSDLNTLVTNQSRQNAIASLALENELMPQQAALRNASMQQLLEAADAGVPGADEALTAALAQLRSVSESPEITADFTQLPGDSALSLLAREMSLEDLQRGGELSPEVRNEVTRRALSTAGTVGGGQLGQARAIVPRDLGLSSFNLRNDRIGRAAQLGQQDDASALQRFIATNQLALQGANLKQQGQTQKTAQTSQLASTIANLSNLPLQQQLAIAQFASQLTPPQVGLDPASAANIYLGQKNANVTAGTNAAALRGQAGQNTGQAIGAIGGLFGTVANNLPKKTASAAPATTPAPSYQLPDFNDPQYNLTYP